tara:strand:- start:8 stop:607 length:600 start_codon:yes stop_codon:yes gene_type:complete
MMLVEETTVPQQALPVATFKDHMRMGSGFSDDDLQDGVLEGFLRAALAAIEARTGKITIERTFSLTLTAWRDGRSQALPLAPVRTIIGVTLLDRNGSEVQVDTASYRLIEDAHRPQVEAFGSTLPSVPQGGAVRIYMSAGYGPDWADLPSDLAQAVLMLAAHFYEYRHETAMSGQQMPFGVSTLIERYRNIRLFSGGRL